MIGNILSLIMVFLGIILLGIIFMNLFMTPMSYCTRCKKHNIPILGMFSKYQLCTECQFHLKSKLIKAAEKELDDTITKSKRKNHD